MGIADSLAVAADAATTGGIVVGVVAGIAAVRSMRSQARSVNLSAVRATNDLWSRIGSHAEVEVTFRAETLAAVRTIYEEMGLRSALGGGGSVPDVDVVAKVPFAVALLLPKGIQDEVRAPSSDAVYLGQARVRTLALGIVITKLENADLTPWLGEAERVLVREDLNRMQKAMDRWVSELNEIAEFYEVELLDRRLFVRKRSVAIVQRMFCAEPYILWRNSVVPGRWGLRLLGLGAEARIYHWNSHLQRACLRLSSSPPGLAATASYTGFKEEVGWMIGPGHMPSHSVTRWYSERRLSRRLGSGFSSSVKRRQSDEIARLPRSKDSGLRVSGATWREASRADDPGDVRGQIRDLVVPG